VANSSAPDLIDVLAERDYPGRGVALGRDVNGTGFALYWLTGRSAASRERYLDVHAGAVDVKDASDGPRDALRHYTAVRQSASALIVGNGDQVTPLFERVTAGTPFEAAVRDIAYEPDPPIFTPRITAYATRAEDGGMRDVCVSGAVPVSGWPGQAQQRTVHVAALEPGQSIAITTYTGDAATPAPSGIALNASVGDTWQAVAEKLWAALNPQYRVALIGFDVAQGLGSAIVQAARLP
jgi:IMP cyclohydrolase